MTTVVASASVRKNVDGISSWYALAVLLLVMLFALADRNIFYLLAEPVRVHLHLTDLQLGLLQGLGISLFSAAASFPLGWLADRYERRVILVACVIVWSAAVFGCGYARDFNELFIASAFVGVGEAGLIPIAYGLIPNLFGPERRILANSVFAVGTKLCVSAGFIACGLLIRQIELDRALLPDALRSLDVWRLSFFAAALPAPLMIALIFTIRTTRSGAPEPRDDEQRRPDGLLRFLAANKSTMACLLAGLSAVGFGFSAASSWIPVIARRVYGASATEVGSAVGASTFIGTTAGFVVGILVTRWLAKRIGPVLPVRIMWTAAAAGAATSAMMLMATSAAALYVLQGVQVAFTMAAVMVFPTALQAISPERMRSQMASLTYIVGVLGGSLSPLAVGALSDRLQTMPNGLLVAAVGVAVIGLLVATTFLRAVEGTFERTVDAARREDDLQTRARAASA